MSVIDRVAAVLAEHLGTNDPEQNLADAMMIVRDVRFARGDFGILSEPNRDALDQVRKHLQLARTNLAKVPPQWQSELGRRARSRSESLAARLNVQPAGLPALISELDSAVGEIIQPLLDSAPDGATQRNWEGVAAFDAIRGVWTTRTKRKGPKTASPETKFGAFAQAVFNELGLGSAASAADSWNKNLRVLAKKVRKSE